MDELSQLVKHTGHQVSSQIQEMQEFAQFTVTITSIIKKLNQTHNALYHTGTGAEEEKINKKLFP